MKTALDTEMAALVGELQRLAAPRDGDRQRITDALRARLGAAVVAGANPGAVGLGHPHTGGQQAPGTTHVASSTGSVLSRGVWLKLLVVTGVVSGALGFVLGYHLKSPGPSPAAAHPASSPVGGTGQRPAAPAALGVAKSAAPTTTEAPGANGAHTTSGKTSGSLAPEGAVEQATSPGNSAGSSHEGAAAGAAKAEAPERSPRPAPPRASPLRAPSAAATAPNTGGAGAGGAGAGGVGVWSFSEVLERLRRANLALGRGQASLALMLLAEIDRHAGGATLREERDVTRVLTLCALDEVAAAQQVAAPLLAGDSGSIYSRRLERSCAAPKAPR